MYLNWKQWPWTPPLIVIEDKSVDMQGAFTKYETELARVKTQMQNLERSLAATSAESAKNKNDIMFVFTNFQRR